MKKFLIFACLYFTACFSFKGITIPTDVDTFYVETVEVREVNAPPELAQVFQETLRQKIRQQSRLVYNDNDPDVVFSPVITKFRVNAVAPQEGDLVAFTRLEISVSIDYENTKNEEDNFKKSWSAFEDFESTQNLYDVQDGLIALIFEDITERVFNDTYSDW